MRFIVGVQSQRAEGARARTRKGPPRTQRISRPAAASTAAAPTLFHGVLDIAPRVSYLTDKFSNLMVK
jgi:hypothetical protein